MLQLKYLAFFSNNYSSNPRYANYKSLVVLVEIIKPGVVVCTCNLSTREAEAGGLQVWGKPGLCSKVLFQEKEKEKKKKLVIKGENLT